MDDVVVVADDADDVAVADNVPAAVVCPVVGRFGRCSRGWRGVEMSSRPGDSNGRKENRTQEELPWSA